MTTKLEKEFFIQFNIPKLKPCEYNYGCGHAVPCEQCPRKDTYPKVTSTYILKLMKILLKWRVHLEILPYFGTYCISTGTELYSEKADNISDAVLYNCIKHSDDKNMVKDIQKLFKAKEIK